MRYCYCKKLSIIQDIFLQAEGVNAIQDSELFPEIFQIIDLRYKKGDIEEKRLL